MQRESKDLRKECSGMFQMTRYTPDPHQQPDIRVGSYEDMVVFSRNFLSEHESYIEIRNMRTSALYYAAFRDNDGTVNETVLNQ